MFLTGPQGLAQPYALLRTRLGWETPPPSASEPLVLPDEQDRPCRLRAGRPRYRSGLRCPLRGCHPLPSSSPDLLSTYTLVLFIVDICPLPADALSRCGIAMLTARSIAFQQSWAPSRPSQTLCSSGKRQISGPSPISRTLSPALPRDPCLGNRLTRERSLGGEDALSGYPIEWSPGYSHTPQRAPATKASLAPTCLLKAESYET